MLPFKSVTLTSPHPGPKVVVLGAVHGNETCGAVAIRRVIQEIDAGALALKAGALTLVPVTNPLAYQQRQRKGERDLNRRLAPAATPRDNEDHVANWLCPLLARHDVLLDLHSFQAGEMPFVLLGPEDNAGAIEPFSSAAREAALALRLGVHRFVEGWLSCYTSAAARRGGVTAETSVLQGTGTTEYMRSVGGWALTLECGQHDDPRAPEVGYQAILRTLAHLGLTDAPDPQPVASMEGLHLSEVIDRENTGDRFARDWKSFDAVAAGQLLATRHDGSKVVAPFAGWVVFPKHDADVGQEWFYLAKPSRRFDR